MCMEDGLKGTAQTNVPSLVLCSLIASFLLFLLIVFRFEHYDSPPIVAILGILLLNSLLELLFTLPSYFSAIPNWVCLASMTGTTFFRLASYYWLIFVTRLVYRERLEPGKFVDLTRFIGKNVIFTYIPSVVVTIVILIVTNIDDTASESNCWRIIGELETTDIIVYLASFVLPNALALATVLFFLGAYFRIKSKAPASLCLYFPLVALPFMAYYLCLKLMILFKIWDFNNLLEVPLSCHLFGYGVIFALMLCNMTRGKRPTSSDLTIAEESSFSDSMIQPIPPPGQDFS